MFLRARRTHLTPEQAGLVRDNRRRRTPGLRREELADLAGISIDYYIRLERGSERHPSPAVVDSLARALQLDAGEHNHLRALAALVDRTDRRENVVSSREVAPGILLLLEQLRPFPASVTNRLGDLLAWNVGGIRMYPGIEEWPAERRNLARYAFLHPVARELFRNITRQYTTIVSRLRQLAALEPEAVDLRELVAELLEESPHFHQLWERYDIDQCQHGRKELNHPIVGQLTVNYQNMLLDGAEGHRLTSFYAEPGSPEYAAFMRLDKLGDPVAEASMCR